MFICPERGSRVPSRGSLQETGERIGGRGGGLNGEKGGWEVYRKREKRGQKAGFPFPFTLRKKTNEQTNKQTNKQANKTKQNKLKTREPAKLGREPGLKGTRRGRFSPLSPHPRKKRMAIDSKVEFKYQSYSFDDHGQQRRRSFT